MVMSVLTGGVAVCLLAALLSHVNGRRKSK